MFDFMHKFHNIECQKTWKFDNFGEVGDFRKIWQEKCCKDVVSFVSSVAIPEKVYEKCCDCEKIEFTPIGVNCKVGYRLTVFRISSVFSRNIPRNTKNSLHTFHISFKFHVSLMLQKNCKTLRCFAQMLTLAQNDAKCEKRDQKRKQKVTHNTLLYTFCFSHFTNVFIYFAISV